MPLRFPIDERFTRAGCPGKGRLVRATLLIGESSRLNC